ncbi:alkane 1-monooxygenase [Aliiroseovarius sp. KMU-50]|uniref:Alkane 1-monooxygenase n=1 Tax=Aliiroseovarius salicola TaxID=3009082 RepID=A0ABT4VZ67_9RHOB|nr:alkane 1-monooxygenase [Aliiroseovarius sp. KMU-50]MDA5093501.1 alkane 1-monooxygenase [Aliiroseovarius sp. KMU-50]
MTHRLRYFAIASVTPVVLLALGAIFGGWLAVSALIYMTLLSFILDEGVSKLAGAADPEEEFTAANQLSTILAASHFLLLPLMIFALTGGTGISIGAGAALFLAAGLFFGQVSNSNAHELIHRTDRLLFNLGKWVYISLLFGHHTSAHNKVHHRFVASDDDPNSAREGETFYAFAPRAWKGSFVAGYEMEKADIARAKTSGKRRVNPYLTYVSGAVLMLILAWVIAGGMGLVVYLVLCFHAQIQLLLSDYVQHYGLMRARRPDGSYEPVGEHHSWNSPHWFTSHLMMNAPRHSDHHAHPSRPYPALRLPDATRAPMLPYSLPTMATLALFPTLWNRVMGRSLARWQDIRKV